MKTKLIIIPGAKALRSEIKIIQKSILFIYRHFFNFMPKYEVKEQLWKEQFQKNDNLEPIWLNWSGKIIPYGIIEAAKQVVKILNNNSDYNFIFFTDSIGTEIALSAIERCNTQNVKGLVAICPVNKPRKINNFPAIFLNSKSDIFAKFSNKILWPLKIFNSTKGNIKILNFDNIRHDQFLPNFKINKNQTLFELIEDKINLNL